MSRPDIVNPLPGGWREEIKIAKRPRADGSQSRMRKIVDPDGVTREVWHEVLDRQGNVIHQHDKLKD